MSSPNHSTSNIEEAFSSMNILNYTSVSSDYFPASSGSSSFNSSKDSRDGMIPPTFSLFYNNLYLKDVQAFYVKESPIPPPDLITPLVILTPSPQDRILVPPSFPTYTPTPPQIYELGKSSIKMHIKHNEEQVESIVDYLEELSFHYIEKLEERLMPPKRTSTSEASTMTHAAIRKLVADRVATALEAQALTMAIINNPNKNSGPRKTPIARKCTYENEFPTFLLQCNCAKKNKVKFAINTLTEEALFWWNSIAQPIGVEEAYKITWSEFKRLLIKKYCPQTEIEKMEEAITITQKLIKQVMKHNSVQETNNHKRKFDDERNTTDNNNYPKDHNNNNHSNNRNNNRSNNHHQQQNKRQETFRAYTANNGYTGNRPLCTRCTLHHIGPCTVRCRICNKIGHQTRNCRNKGPSNY
ncbi:hypothetical protein Tco_0257746 [Tanacetum coccineum]